MNVKDVDKFEKLWSQLSGTYEEITLLSKKSPNDALNKFKLKFVNRLIAQSNDFLGADYIPFEDFVHFDEDDVPQNSDVVFILSQYLQCFEKLRSDNVVQKYGACHWRVEGEDEDKADEIDDDGMHFLRTVQPKKLKG